MVSENWLERWEQGRIGWHEASGNATLRRYWKPLVSGSRVLVPLCGKSVDLLWLEARGLAVTGVELSSLAIEAFFTESALQFRRTKRGRFQVYEALEKNMTLFCGDYAAFEAEPFDAVYDRGALVALPAAERPRYAVHTARMLDADAFHLLITLDYDQERINGPPYAVAAQEVRHYWPNLHCVEARNDIANSPPKFRDAGLTVVTEQVWVSPAHSRAVASVPSARAAI